MTGSNDPGVPTPTPTTVQAFYDQTYYGSHVSGDGIDWHGNLIASRLGDLAGKRALDVACGTGAWLQRLRASGARVDGIDISQVAVEACRRRLPEARIEQGVAENLPFDTGAYDLVTCLGSLEHFLDQSGSLREMARVSRDDGRILILVPNAGFLTRKLGLYRGTGQVAIRETVRPLMEWQRMFESVGLQVEARWRDLHPLSLSWIASGPPWRWPVRAAQALALTMWPIAWQYQVYFLCRKLRDSPQDGAGP
jgi:SAM-dependent methyltransferase